MKRWLLVLLVLTVYVLHQDFWNWRIAMPLAFGFLPVGLWYHAGFSVVSSLTMAVLVKFAWPSGLEKYDDNASKEDKA